MTPATAATTECVIVEQQLDAPFAAAWAALTRPELVSRWLTRCTRLSARSYALTFDDDGNNGSGYVKTVRLLRLRHRADQAGYSVLLQDPGYPDSMVTVELTAVGNAASALVLSHLDPPRRLVEGYRTGWRDYLATLARLLPTALRGEADRQPSRKDIDDDGR